ncbi:MAG: formate dehydrogenase accessory sulfurtransferase FdhD [Chloroflexota bacterium]
MSAVSGSGEASVATTPLLAFRDGVSSEERDLVVVEQPLEIRLAGLTVTVTMCTPGDELDLAAGFLFSEGIIGRNQDIASISRCQPDVGAAVNVNPIDAALVQPERWQRNFAATSSCGLCGSASLEAVHKSVEPLVSNAQIDIETLYHMEAELRNRQPLFRRTGGLHAAAIFDLNGRVLSVREDIGRHNAVDKVLGAMLRADRLPSECVLLVSSRASFEIVQKALVARIPILATVSAASSLAVEIAVAGGLTLAGFLRGGSDQRRCNVYAGAQRIRHDVSRT